MDEREKDLIDLINKMAKKNYEEPEGLFYKIYENLKVPFDNLNESVKTSIVTEVGRMLMRGNVDTRWSEKDSKKLFNDIDKSAPSDYIILKTRNDTNKFREFWKKPGFKYHGTPCDLFYAETIPLKNFIVRMEYDWFSEGDDEVTSESFVDFVKENIYVHFVVFDDYMQKLYHPDLEHPIGTVIIVFKKKKEDVRVAIPFYPSGDKNFVMFNGIAYSDNISKNDVGGINIYELHKSMTKLLDIWYGIQLALLNPITEVVFQNARETTQSVRKNKVGLGKKRRVVYTKKYVISAEDIDNSYQEHRKNNMQCPLWYVIGHWRTYSSGKKIFIKGYWKGPERERLNGVTLEQETIRTITSVVRERKVLIKDGINE